MAIGNVNTYLTDAPLQKNYIGEAMDNVEQNGFRYRQEQRLADEKKKLAKEKQDAELETDLGKIKSDTTKFSTQNALIIDAMTKLKNGVGQKAKEMNEGKISRLDYNIYKSNAEAQIGLIDQSAKRINAQAQAYAKDVAEQKIPSGFEENALNFGGAYEKNNIYLELQPDGTFKTMVYDDTDPNNIKILDKGDLSTIGQNAFTPVYKYDFDKDKTEFLKTYPKVLNERLIGETKVGTKSISPEIEKAMDLKIDSIIKDRNALAIRAREITGNPNPNVTDPDVINQVVSKIKDEFMGMYSPEKTIDEATQRASEARARKKDAKDEIVIGTAKFGDRRSDNFMEFETKAKNSTGGTTTTKHIQGVDGDTVYQNIITVGEGKLPFKNLGGSNSKLNGGYVEGFTKDKKTGDIVVTGKALKEKGVKFKVNGKLVELQELQKMAEDGNYEAQAKLDNYSSGDNYGTFVRRVPEIEVSNLLLKTPIKTIANLNKQLDELNQDEEVTTESAGKYSKYNKK